MINLKSEDALRLISQGVAIENCIVQERIDITNLGLELMNDVIIKGCSIAEFYSPSVVFKGKLIFSSTKFNRCVFNYSYFTKGIRIERSRFEEYLDFESGGHNKFGDIELIDNQFQGFVNFFDCWFHGNVIVKNNSFTSGTNLQGNKGRQFEVRFDQLLSVENNLGRMDINGEGERDENVISM